MRDTLAEAIGTFAYNCPWGSLAGFHKLISIQNASQILSLSTDSCRIAVVRKARLDTPDAPPSFTKHEADVYGIAQLDMVGDGYVKEVKE